MFPLHNVQEHSCMNIWCTYLCRYRFLHGILLLDTCSHGQMDKASIVSDAINYVRQLQQQVAEIQADIAELESQKDGCHKKDMKHVKLEKMRGHKDVKRAKMEETQEHQIVSVCMLFVVEYTLRSSWHVYGS